MGSNERKQRLKQFLDKFENSPIILFQNNQSMGPMEEFLLTYFGKCFIEGYRIVQRIDKNIFILSLMEFQTGGNPNFLIPKSHKNIKHGRQKIICIQLNQKKINQDREIRTKYFKKIKQIAQFFCGSQTEVQNCQGVQINFVFADNFQYAVANYELLQKGSSLPLQKFYQRDYGIGKKDEKQGLKTLDQKQQGTKLHEFVQLILKGAGQIQNTRYFSRSVLHQSKFSYNLWMIINTLCLIIGKQIIEGGYSTISSQKWMRKFSEKKFKKFDLLLRNEKKVCILDWKFSRMNANQKILTQAFAQKNLQYFQLARQDYNAEVQLKFYCFHKSHSSTHHKYTVANYKYSIQQIEIRDSEDIQGGVIEIDSDSSIDFGRSKSQKKSLKARFNKKQQQFSSQDQEQQKQHANQKLGSDKSYNKTPKIFKRFEYEPNIGSSKIIKDKQEKLKQQVQFRLLNQIQRQQVQQKQQNINKFEEQQGNILYDTKTQTFVFSKPLVKISNEARKQQQKPTKQKINNCIEIEQSVSEDQHQNQNNSDKNPNKKVFNKNILSHQNKPNKKQFDIQPDSSIKKQIQRQAQMILQKNLTSAPKCNNALQKISKNQIKEIKIAHKFIQIQQNSQEDCIVID